MIITMRPHSVTPVSKDGVMYYAIHYDRNVDVFVKCEVLDKARRISYKPTPVEELCYELLGEWPVLASKDDSGNWYKFKTMREVIDSGMLDITGKFVEIVFDKPLRINNRKIVKATVFAHMIQDDETGEWLYADRRNEPDYIKAYYEYKYPPFDLPID